MPTAEVMKLETLQLENIGPFDEARVEFSDPGAGTGVTIITGENGTGKSVIIDALRAIIGGPDAKVG